MTVATACVGWFPLISPVRQVQAKTHCVMRPLAEGAVLPPHLMHRLSGDTIFALAAQRSIVEEQTRVEDKPSFIMAEIGPSYGT